MRKMFEMLKPHLLAVSGLMLIVTLASFLSVWSATLTKKAVDFATLGKEAEYIEVVAVLITVTIFVIAMKIIYQINSEKIKAKIEIKLKSKALHDFMKSDYAKTKQFSDGDVITRLSSDVKTVSETAVQLPVTICSISAKLVGVLYVLSTISKVFVIVLPILLIIIVTVSLFFKKTLKKLYKKQQEKEGKVLNLFREVLKNLPVIKAFIMYDDIDEKADTLQYEHYKARMKRKIFSVISGTGMTVIFETCNLVAVVICLIGIIMKTLSAGSITAVVQIFVQMKNPISNLTSFFPAYYSMSAAMDRISELSMIYEDNNINQYTGQILNAESIVFENVSFKYDGEWILKNFSCDIPLNRITVIEGESGKGKSTILKLLLGLYRPNAGNIYIRTAVENISLNQVVGLFSYVPQDAQLFSESISYNLRIANSEADEHDMRCALCRSQIYKFVNELSDGINYVIGEKGHNFSEGQLQRIAIARAFVSNAPVMLMDEPTSALDDVTEKSLIENLDKNRDRTYVIVSHKKGIEKICDKIIYI